MSEASIKPSITLWGAGTSRSIRPIWTAEELGIAYNLQPIGPRSGETKTPQYTGLNPKQKIPFLEDGSIKLSESVAICRYLVSKYGSETTLFRPQSLEQQAKEDEWLCFIFGELDETSLYVIRRHAGLPEIYGEAPTAVSSAKDYVVRQLGVIEQHLQDKQYLLNERFSLPDLFLITCLEWAKFVDIAIPDNLEEYRARITKRPAYKKASAVNKANIVKA